MKISLENLVTMRREINTAGLESYDMYATKPEKVLIGRIFLMPDAQWHVFFHYWDWSNEKFLYYGNHRSKAIAELAITNTAIQFNSFTED